MRIVVQTLVRDNGKWLRNFVTMVAAIENARPDIELDVHVWENDSKDDSRDFLEKNKSVTLHGGPQPDPDRPRTVRLAGYRNGLKEAVDIRGADYVLMIDSGIWFGKKALEHMIETLEKHKDIAMVAPHAIVKDHAPCTFYYDTFATILMGGEKAEPFTNLFPCEAAKSKKHARHCHYAKGDDPLLRWPNRYFDVMSTFGGFVLIRPDVFEGAKWAVNNERECEHWAFCKDIKDAGHRIVIDRNAKVLWSEWS